MPSWFTYMYGTFSCGLWNYNCKLSSNWGETPFCHRSIFISAGLQIRVCKRNPSFLTLNQNIPCGCSKELSQWDECLTADPGVASSIPVWSHTFVEIDHEIISTVILLLPLIYSRRVVVSYKRKYVHELLVNRLFKPAQEKVWLGELTVPQWP